MKPPAPQGEGNFRILLMEDDTEIAKLVLSYLSTLKFECHHAANGLAGMDEFKRVAPHMVLLDLLMPGLGGHDVLAKIRETSTIPVIVLTALPEEALKSFRAGADDFVAKPFDPKMLVARVVAQLRRAYKYDKCEHEDEDDDEDPIIREGRRNAANGSEAESSGSKVPAGWATCDACGYIGPRTKFEYLKPDGQRSILCPVCKQADWVIFSIG